MAPEPLSHAEAAAIAKLRHKSYNLAFGIVDLKVEIIHATLCSSGSWPENCNRGGLLPAFFCFSDKAGHTHPRKRSLMRCPEDYLKPLLENLANIPNSDLIGEVPVGLPWSVVALEGSCMNFHRYFMTTPKFAPDFSGPISY